MSLDAKQQVDAVQFDQGSGRDLIRRAVRKDGRFENPVPTEMGGFRLMLQVLPRYLQGGTERSPRVPLGPFRTDITAFRTEPASGLRVTWMGHSSLLVEIDGVRVLIDPVWEQRASPLQWFGPKRFFAPPLALADLPSLDAVLISHDHFDHLGARTVATLARLPQTRTAQWVTSLGVGSLLRRCGVDRGRLHELDWTEGLDVTGAGAGPVTVRAWPARHFSGRGLRDRFRTLWSSFSLQGSVHSVFYGADSGYWEGFASIADACGGFDLTMLEIGAFDELWAPIHLGPDGAVRAFEEMSRVAKRMRGQAGLLMPIHWGLFDLALHAWNQPIERLAELSSARGVELFAPAPGQPTEVVKGGEFLSGWWRRS